MATRPVCPAGYRISPVNPSMCVVECSARDGFENRNINGEPYCVYRDRDKFKVLLREAPAFQLGEGTPVPVFNSTWSRSTRYWDFKAIKDDYDSKVAIVKGEIDKEVGRDAMLKDAFGALQTAENVRDQSPQAYQEARNRYYTLLRGEGWLNEESQRLANAEVVPKISQYSQVRNDLKARLNQQQQTIDVVNSVKDKVLSMRDDFAYTTNTFAKQITELKNQINIEKKKTEEEKMQTISWVDTLLNVFITILVVALLFVVIRKVVTRPSPSPSSSVYTSMRR
jgi:hypothetical protein